MKRFMSGLICLISGIVLEIICNYIILSDQTPKTIFDRYYSYDPPSTFHEIFMISLTVFSVFAILAGIALLIIEFLKGKNDKIK